MPRNVSLVGLAQRGVFPQNNSTSECSICDPVVLLADAYVMPTLKDGRGGGPRRRAQHVLVVAQIAISFLILVAAGLFVRTLNNLHSIQLGYARENILLFLLNARQVGHRPPEIATFCANLRKRFESIPGVSSATLSQSSIISAGRAGSQIRGTMNIGAVTIEDARVLVVGPRHQPRPRCRWHGPAGQLHCSRWCGERLCQPLADLERFSQPDWSIAYKWIAKELLQRGSPAHKSPPSSATAVRGFRDNTPTRTIISDRDDGTRQARCNCSFADQTANGSATASTIPPVQIREEWFA